MLLASVRFDQSDRIGVSADAKNVILLDQLIGASAPADMVQVIDAGPTLLDDIRDAISDLPDVATVGVDDIEWHPPVRRPGKILGVALNNSASNARKISAPDHPLFFLKPASCLLGHRQPLRVRPYYGSLHPEPELAVVIGRHMRAVGPDEAMEGVFGYSIMNDVTGNAMRSEDMVHYYALYASPTDPEQVERREQHLSYAARYKGTDGFGPMGPWIATADSIADPSALDVVCRVGGEVVAEDSTRYLSYDVGEIIAFISQFQTLDPGDIISMGTAFRQRPGTRRSLHLANLQTVDGPMEVSIAGLGVLETPVERVDTPMRAWQRGPVSTSPES
jgi:2-keto-4-pentenoate hydratase/2-oxohepta-3-ene-1,7-dioic acid hydratase in catechol pathway